MGLSKSKQKTKIDQTENVTQKPITPPELSAPIVAMGPRIEGFLNSDPGQYVAPASPLQEQAFGFQPGGWKAPLDSALAMVQNTAAAPATTAGVHQATTQGYSAPRLGNAAQAEMVKVAPNSHATAQSLLTGLKAYQDPYIRDVVNATLRDYDQQTGRQAAQLAAAGARGGAFGGSRFGLAEGQFQGEAGRGRAATTASLLSDSFKTAAQLSGQDADRRQGASLFNAGADNNRNAFQAQLEAARLGANTDRTNQFGLAQAGLDEAAARYGADAANQASMFNTGALNQNEALNASLAEAQRARELEAAGMTANIGQAIGANTLADTAMTADLGQIQREIEAAKLNAVPTQLQLGAGLLSGLPYPAVVGNQTNGLTQGTTTTTSSPGLLPMMAGLAGSGLAGWAAGGFQPIKF